MEYLKWRYIFAKYYPVFKFSYWHKKFESKNNFFFGLLGILLTKINCYNDLKLGSLMVLIWPCYRKAALEF